MNEKRLKELDRIKNKLRTITLVELSDMKVRKELTDIYVILSDIFNMVHKRFLEPLFFSDKRSEISKNQSIIKAREKIARLKEK